MTCIVGLMHEGRVYMGADSAGVSGLDLMVRADPKVFRNGEFLIGFTTSFRMGQILRAHLRAIVPPAVDLDRYMEESFVEQVRLTLKERGYAVVNNNQETGGEFLVGVRGHLYLMGSDFQVGRSLLPYWAVGCGAQIALGALYSTFLMPPDRRLMLALEAAEQFSVGVRRPFIVLEEEHA